MGALVQTNATLLTPFKAFEARFRQIEASSKPFNGAVRAILAYEPHAFAEAITSPMLPMTIRDEMLEFYAFVFCQGGFRQLGMTFEQFLLVAAAIKPADLPATREEAWTL